MAEASLFVWYHAEPGLETSLRRWLTEVERGLGYRGALFRRDEGGRTTYMEVYGEVDAAAAARIEALAARQPWIGRLAGPRRCEAFVPVAPDAP